MPRVSVILNCYNHEAYVAEAVDSVLAQTFANFEMILIDNGSTDGSRAILNRFDDPRIRRFYHDQNESLSKRLNEGLAEAASEFAAVLYSDDIMLPDKLERQVAMFDTLPADYGVVYCPAIGFNQFTGARWTFPSFGLSGNIATRMFDRFFDGMVDMSSPLTRTACLRENGWHEDLFIDGEAVFFRIAIDWKFHFDPAPTVMLRDHDSNLSKGLRRNADMSLEIVRRLADSGRVDIPTLAALRRHRARYAVQSAWAYARSGGTDRRWVMDHLRNAVRIYPAIAAAPRYIAAAALIAIPGALRSWANALGDRMKPSGHNRGLIDRA